MSDEIKRTDERVRVRAYELWEKDGRPHGRNEVYWEEALRQIQEQDRLKDASLRSVPLAPRPAQDARRA
jgi:hypothetical protein